MKCISMLALACAWIWWSAISAWGQGVGASGNIDGKVTDPSGAVIPKAQIVAAEADRAIHHVVATDNAGMYRLEGLAPGIYSITAQATGFQTEEQTGVAVTVGAIAVLDFHLQVATSRQEIQVTAEPPVVETERGSQADTITQNYIADLPIDRRDYLTFTLLMPGVANATRVAGDQDFRVKQTPQSGLSFYGSNGRGNSVTVDGGEANDDAGGVRPNLSQDAVQEFQINRSNYSAELGGASGASLNIVSKSGTNTVYGSLYGFFRDDIFDARDRFAFSQALQPGQIFNPAVADTTGKPIKNSLNRQQFGGAIGVPVQKDKTFLFVAFEGLRQDAENAVPLLTNTSIFRPTAQQNAILAGLTGVSNVPCLTNPNGTITFLPATTCAFALQSILTINANPGANPFVSASQAAVNNFIVNQFENNGGLFSYNTREYQFSARADHQFSENNQAYLRYNYTHDLEESPDVQSLTGLSAGSSIHEFDHTVQGAWYHQFNANMSNEARAQFNYNYMGVIPNEPGEVGLQISGYANLGTNIFLPNLAILRRYEFADNLSVIRGRHSLRFGGYELLRGNHSEAHIFMPGRFIFGELPGGVLSPCLQAPAACGLSANLSPATIDSLQAVSLGAPQLLQQGFGNPAYADQRPYTAFYWQDSWSIRPNLTITYGLRYEMDTEFAPLKSDRNNFAPRLSFAWDPFRDHTTVVRGGYGIFYGSSYFQIPDVDRVLGLLNANGSAVENQGGGNQVANATASCGILGVSPGNGSSPCNRQIAIYIVPLTGDPTNPAVTAATVFGGLFAQGAVQCTKPTAGNEACITPTALSGLIGEPITHTGQIPPLAVLFSNQRNYQDPYSQQAELGIERQLSPGFSISVSYIHSHTLKLPVALDTNLLPASKETVTLANGKTVSYRDWNSNPSLDPIGAAPCAGAAIFTCFANPLIAQNNQYSSGASALYQGGILEIKKRFSEHVTLLANYTYSKAFDTTTDYNSDYAPQDETNLAADRSLSEFDERNKVVIAAVLDSPWAGKILSGFQLAPVFTYHSGLPFNLLAGEDANGDNHSTTDRPIGAGRDTGLGPNYADLDMRLSWRYKFTEATNLQFTLEGFNLANRENFASVNNEVGPGFGLPVAAGGSGFTTFNVHGSAAISPSQPLGFTSDFPKREFQLGVRFSF